MSTVDWPSVWLGAAGGAIFTCLVLAFALDWLPGRRK